jgi:hypothetical protein
VNRMSGGVGAGEGNLPDYPIPRSQRGGKRSSICPAVSER